jgi:putative transposase
LKKQEATSWLKEVNSQTLQFAIRSLEVAYTNFFQKRAKFPNFKSKHSKNSLPFPNLHLLQVAGFSYPSSRGYQVPCTPRDKRQIGKVTISKTPSGKYFVSVFTEEEYNNSD